MKTRIGIISDLHCHNKTKNKNIQESYLLTDQKAPEFQDPLKSFEILIEQLKSDGDELTIDNLIVLGDYTNKIDIEGLEYGWKAVQKIAKISNTKTIIANVGNHDIDSRAIHTSDPFHFIKKLNDNQFPFNDFVMNTEFWDAGFSIIEDSDLRLVVVNTVFNHRNEQEAEHGLIAESSINKLREALKHQIDNKIKIAICHHNPIEHSRYASGNKDSMYNGDEFIELLDQNNFDLILHGHKHDPRVRYSPGSSESPLLFSVGSFSAFKTLLLQGAYNTFHIIDIEKNHNSKAKGIIKTWFFVPTKGWKQEVANDFIKSTVGFGYRVSILEKAEEIYLYLSTKSEKFLEWEEFILIFPDIKYLIPSDFNKLKDALKSKNIYISPIVQNEPVFIQLKSK